MGVFSRLKKDGKSKKKGDVGLSEEPVGPQWTDAWARTVVEPEEVHELVKRCTEEIKNRALDHPFLLLPFRPTSDPSAVRTFVRHFFDNNAVRGEALAQELRMTEPMVITGVIKWCWSRLQGGVVGWDAYELFKVGEQDSNMARDSFKTFIPLSVENGARSSIIFSFFDLMSAIAAHGKMNGFGGRKLSRMAAWWAFEHKDTSNGFDGGYKSWLKAADATSHLFFAYLRTLGPAQQSPGTISMLPRSLQALLQDTEYPPNRPTLMQASTYKVVMIVDTVSPTPFALLRRGNHFQYREDSLQHFSEYEDPVAALTEECRRVLRAIAAANQTQAVSSAKHSTSLRDASWSRFEDIGFQSTLDEDEEDDLLSSPMRHRVTGLRSTPASGANRGGRPTTPSWADFLSSGFIDDRATSPTSLLPPDKVLPPIDTSVRQQSAQSHRPRLETGSAVEQGELASINRVDLDEAFWWVWMNSLAPEETLDRKAAFGRCAVIETVIRNGRWLVFEEVVKGAANEPAEGAYVAQKKSFFSWRRKDKDKDGVSRAKSTMGKNSSGKGEHQLKNSATTGTLSKTSLGPDQQAKIQAAAQQLQLKQERERIQAQSPPVRRGRTDAELVAEKTQSVMTLQPMIMKEASPAMKWANKYDKDTVREAYLANTFAGRGLGQSTMQSNGVMGTSLSEERSASPLPQSPPALSVQEEMQEGQLSPAATISEKHQNHPLPSLPLEEAPSQSFDIVRDQMTSPEPGEEGSPKHKKLHKDEKKGAGGGGFRKLFGRQRRTSKVMENAPEISSPVAESERQIATPQSETPVRVDTPQQQTPPQQDSEEGHPSQRELVSPISPRQQVDTPPAAVVSDDEDHHVNSTDADEAKNEFSRFDQGPLEDQPAFVPESDDEGYETPPPVQRHQSPIRQPKPELELRSEPTSTPVPAPLPQQASEPVAQPESEAPRENKPKPRPRPRPMGASEPETAPAIERWAQIRKNAAERAAAAQQQSSQQRQRGPPSRLPAPSKPVASQDAGGEESIESRVARIKARVAELTNNMDGAPAPGVPGARPPMPR